MAMAVLFTIKSIAYLFFIHYVLGTYMRDSHFKDIGGVQTQMHQIEKEFQSETEIHDIIIKWISECFCVLHYLILLLI